MLAQFRAGMLSPVEVTRDALDRIARTDGAVNAFVCVDGDGALEAARASERRWRRGESAGLLDGVPVAVKDLIGIAGQPIRRGSLALSADGRSPEDAPVVARMREHGAVFVGKTATPESGCKVVTESAVHGVTRSPFDRRLTPGGSSGGSAAALALGAVPIALGTDGAGSIRIPAAFCNVFGLKPSFGRVPIHPPSLFAPHAVTGPMTRTVADTALAYNVVTLPEHRDPYALPHDGRDWRAGLEDGVRGMRVAFSPTLGGDVPVDPEVAALVAAAARDFEALGADVEPADPVWPCDPLETFLVFWRVMYAQSLRTYTTAQRERVDPVIRRVSEEAAGITLEQYLAAQRDRAAMAAAMMQFHTRYDLLLTPVMPVPPWPAGRMTPEGVPEDDWAWCPFTYPFNLTQQPAASVPCGLTPAGLPVGLQIVAAVNGERLILRAAQALEALRPWGHLYPSFPPVAEAA